MNEIITDLNWRLEPARSRNRVDITGSVDGHDCVTVTYLENRYGRLMSSFSIDEEFIEESVWQEWDGFKAAVCHAALLWAKDRKRPSRRLKTLGVDVESELERLDRVQ